MITIGSSFMGKNLFFVEKYDKKKWRKLELFFVISCRFSFFLFLDNFLSLL